MLVQETHGAEVEWLRLAEALRHSHRMLHSTAGEFRQGGIAFFIKLDTFPEERFVYYLDVVIDLGGKEIEERSLFGNPPNDAAHGFEKGVFFIYDPAVEFDGMVDSATAIIIWSVVGGIVLLLVVGLSAHALWKKRQDSTPTADESSAEKTSALLEKA